MHMSVLRQPLLNKSLTYNPITDLTYILQVTGYVMGVVVRTDAPWRAQAAAPAQSVAGLIAVTPSTPEGSRKA